MSTFTVSVNGTDESSAAYYLATLEAAGIDASELSFVEIVAVTRQLHGEWQRSDARRDERDAIAAEKENARKQARLAALAKKKDALVAAQKRDTERAQKRAAALAELEEAGL
jgi:hypothetical protein